MIYNSVFSICGVRARWFFSFFVENFINSQQEAFLYACNGSDVVMKSCAIPLLNSQVTLDDEFRHQKVSSFLLLRQNKKKLVVCENLC